MRCTLFKNAKSTCFSPIWAVGGWTVMILKYAFMLASLHINVSKLSFKIALISATWQRNSNVNIFMMQNWCLCRFISNALEMIYSIRLRNKRIKKCSCKNEILHAIWSASQIMTLRKQEQLKSNARVGWRKQLFVWNFHINLNTSSVVRNQMKVS